MHPLSFLHRFLMHLAQTTYTEPAHYHQETFSTPTYQQPAQEYTQTQQYHTGAIVAPEHHFESQQHHSFESQPRKY